MGCRTRFNRTRQALLHVTELLRQKISQVFPIPHSRYFVIDSFPLPICKFGRRITAAPSGRLEPIMGDARLKKEPIWDSNLGHPKSRLMNYFIHHPINHSNPLSLRVCQYRTKNFDYTLKCHIFYFHYSAILIVMYIPNLSS